MTEHEVVFRFSGPGDEPALKALLESVGLPTEDVRHGEQDCILALHAGRVVGSVGLEKHERAVLLRSFAVVPELRGQGLGSKLYERIVAHAVLRGAESAFVLTTTAERFCAVRGFERLDRASVPGWLRETAEFRSLCPSTAVCMRRRLDIEARHFPADVLCVRPDVPGAAKWAVALERAMLTYFEVEPHSKFEAHRHESEQITLVLEGELFFEIAAKRIAARAGDVIAIPSNAEHSAWTEERGARAVDAWSPVRRDYLA
jgi:N-acetylglutamate synthase-like GNAT family acetyltransferase/quercetin dioxygenase-like cupin family protein